MTKDKALNLALEAFLCLPPSAWTPENAKHNLAVVTAINEALAQPEQEVKHD